MTAFCNHDVTTRLFPQKAGLGAWDAVGNWSPVVGLLPGLDLQERLPLSSATAGHVTREESTKWQAEREEDPVEAAAAAVGGSQPSGKSTCQNVDAGRWCSRFRPLYTRLLHREYLNYPPAVAFLPSQSAVQGHKDGLEASALVLLQTCLGLAAALGCAAWGVVTARPSAQCLVSRQYLCQAALLGVAIAQVALGSVQGYHGLVLASGLYGASLGGALYSLKMLALERLRARHFARSWALVQAAEALPILLGVPLTGYMNANSSRVGYYACTLSSLCGAALLFLVGWGRQPASPFLSAPNLSNVSIPPPCACPPPPRPRLPKSQSLHVPLDVPLEESLREREMERMHTAEHYYQPQFYGPLRPSKSVPEGLSHQDS
ncbi:unnamed protein product, partial [Heterotrigona itama]